MTMLGLPSLSLVGPFPGIEVVLHHSDEYQFASYHGLFAELSLRRKVVTSHLDFADGYSGLYELGSSLS